MPWDPDRYHLFQKERSAPFEDLLALVQPRPELAVVDLGCGTGELTLQLASHLPGSQVLGIDSSPEMLERAAALARPGLTFQQAAIETMQGEWDVVFSNAAIQWVDDHPRLIPRLFSFVRSGGQLVIQMPSNHGHLAHQLITTTAAEEPFVSALAGWSRTSPVLSIDKYAELLYRSGASDLTVIEKVYPHILADADALADWTSGTALVPYFERLSPGLKDEFLARYRQKLWEHWPDKPVFYGFRRILLATRKGPAGLEAKVRAGLK